MSFCRARLIRNVSQTIVTVLQTLDIITEPVGPTYRALLAFAERCSGSFSLVWRHQLSFAASAAVLEGVLRPFLIEETETSTWPGTRLIGHSATVRTYRLSPDSARALATADGLFAWQSPARPEDLAFYAPDGRCWLGSTAHERDAFVALDEDDLAALRAAAPELELTCSSEGAG
jgi:hypothetical protein